VAALGPVLVAIVGLVWPPLANGDRIFIATIWLGLATLLVLVPSIVGILGQLTAGGPQTLLPSPEAAYPWGIALLGTSLFAGLGLARHRLGAAAMRRHRLVRGLSIGVVAAVATGAVFAGVAIGNELALRDRPIPGSRFGPTLVAEPPTCDAAISVGAAAHLGLTIDAEVDLRPLGSTTIEGSRDGGDFRWTGYVAAEHEFGSIGAARVDGEGWRRDPGTDWQPADAAFVQDETIDSQILAVALLAPNRPAPEERGIAMVEGARARHCRIAIDGPTFAEAHPQIAWLVGEADLRRWRGELDYWIFLDGELGMTSGAIVGDAFGIGVEGVQGEIRASMTATSRSRPHVIVAPGNGP
jgi:hypothetical protein